MSAEEGGQIVVWGRGDERRDLLYVSDLVDFVGAVLNRQSTRFEIFNAGYGSAISVRELVGKIIRHSGKQLEVEHDLTKPCVKTGLCLDSAKAQKEIGWSPKVSLGEGIEKTLKWYQENIAAAMLAVGSDGGQGS
jgi:nucleoside-diphosphate-sugar epimerase